MQIPLSYAEDIIGIGGANIGYIRRSSGAILTVQESRGLPDEITVEIKGSSTQVQMAQQLIQEFISCHKEPVPSMYGKMDAGLNSYSHLSDTAYHSSSFSSLSPGGYGSSNRGPYSSYRAADCMQDSCIFSSQASGITISAIESM
ncbi:K Homology domain, type 1 [Dillenia turbinata]|uniref:K Homology domain, type 1 n=1 Tax=Dillenia turbinata TaxID=194707 RepID=A0AAN8UBJ3_9MAGN